MYREPLTNDADIVVTQEFQKISELTSQGGKHVRKHDPWIISVGPKLNDSETKWFVKQLQKSLAKATPFLTKLPLEGRQRLLALMDQYSNYKTNYVRNYVFDPASSNLSIIIQFSNLIIKIMFT